MKREKSAGSQHSTLCVNHAVLNSRYFKLLDQENHLTRLTRLQQLQILTPPLIYTSPHLKSPTTQSKGNSILNKAIYTHTCSIATHLKLDSPTLIVQKIQMALSKNQRMCIVLMLWLVLVLSNAWQLEAARPLAGSWPSSLSKL